MRISSVAILPVVLAACSSPSTQAAAPGAKVIPCALDGAAAFEPVCTVEDVRSGKQLYWIVRHPDGGFRRFEMLDDGTRIATADGADEVEMTREGAEFIVKAGPDRYHFPAAPDAGPGNAPAK